MVGLTRWSTDSYLLKQSTVLNTDEMFDLKPLLGLSFPKYMSALTQKVERKVSTVLPNISPQLLSFPFSFFSPFLLIATFFSVAFFFSFLFLAILWTFPRHTKSTFWMCKHQFCKLSLHCKYLWRAAEPPYLASLCTRVYAIFYHMHLLFYINSSTDRFSVISILAWAPLTGSCHLIGLLWFLMAEMQIQITMWVMLQPIIRKHRRDIQEYWSDFHRWRMRSLNQLWRIRITPCVFWNCSRSQYQTSYLS